MLKVFMISFGEMSISLTTAVILISLTLITFLSVIISSLSLFMPANSNDKNGV